MDLSGVDFVDITDLEPLYRMDNLTELWLVDTQNVDATELDVLLDNVETIESPDTEGILYMTHADFDAFNTTGGDLLAIWNDEPGHHVEFLQIGDVNHDTEVNGLDVDPFVDVLLASQFDVAADMNGDGAVNGLDVDPFVAAVVSGSHAVPEPSTLVLALVTLGSLVGWRRWSGWGRCCPSLVTLVLLSLLYTAFHSPAAANIYRWDNGELVTEEDAEVGGAELSEISASHAEFEDTRLAETTFRESGMTYTYLVCTVLPEAYLRSAMLRTPTRAQRLEVTQQNGGICDVQTPLQSHGIGKRCPVVGPDKRRPRYDNPRR